MLNCARCRRLVVICTRCDRGQRYCSAPCAELQRRHSVREAGRRYQRTPLGARNNAARQTLDFLAEAFDGLGQRYGQLNSYAAGPRPGAP